MDNKNKAISLARSMIRRMAWEKQCKPLLKKEYITTSLGAERTLEGLVCEIEGKKADFTDTFLSIFQPYYENLLYSGSKTIRIYDLNEDAFNQVWSALDKIDISDSVAKEYFPYLVPDELLTEIDEKPEIIHIDQSDSKKIIFVTSRRKISEKKNINLSDYPESEVLAEVLEQFSQVTGYIYKERQYIDSIVMNRDDYTLELRLDTFSDVKTRDIENLFAQLSNCFKKTVNEHIEHAFNFLVNARNLFPLIDILYKDNDCRIVEIHFCTEDNYIGSEKDRTKTRGGDVRESKFHRGGEKQTAVWPYKLSARWASSFDGEISYEYELSLNSSAAELGKPRPYLDFAIVTSCPTINDMNNIIGLLKKDNETTTDAV